VAQAIVDALVGEQRVEEEGTRAQPGRKRLGDGLRGRAPCLAIGQRKPAQRDVQRHLLAVAGGRALGIDGFGAALGRELHLDR
jgi:hypothetical protein